MHHFLPDIAVSLTEDDPRPRDFPWTVFVRVKLLHRVQRNIGCYRVSVSCIYLCEPDNKLATYCVFPPATCCIWLHGLWPLKIENEKQSNKGNNQLQICKMCYTDRLLFCFITLQTWKTSRHTEEALFPFVKVKEWFCCVAPHHILEVKQHNQTTD